MKWTCSYIAVFAAVQLLSLGLALVGILPIAILATLKRWRIDPTILGGSGWRTSSFFNTLYGNDEDGIFGPKGEFTGSRWHAFYWSAIRNDVNNLRYVRGISGVGRPYSRWTWGATPGGFYIHAGWNASGFPVCSAGRNVNPF